MQAAPAFIRGQIRRDLGQKVTALIAVDELGYPLVWTQK